MNLKSLARGRAGLIGIVLLLGGCQTDGSSGDLAGVLGGVLGDATSGTSQSGLSGFEIEAGLREALTVGTQRVAGQLGRTDGYFADPEIRIPLPGQLGQLQSGLDRVGMSAPLDDLQLRLNRAAEAAVPEARDLVVNAVRTITLEDAMGILNGGNTAATDFLRARTETALQQALTPHMRSALETSGAYSALDSVAARNGLGGLANSLSDDLTTSAVSYGLDGLFLYVSREEQRIRENPVARTSDILRKVFGARS